MASIDDIGTPGQPMSVKPLTAWQAAVRDALNGLRNIPQLTVLGRGASGGIGGLTPSVLRKDFSLADASAIGNQAYPTYADASVPIRNGWTIDPTGSPTGTPCHYTSGLSAAIGDLALHGPLATDRGSCTPGSTLTTHSFWMKSVSGVRNFRPYVYWYDKNGNHISNWYPAPVFIPTKWTNYKYVGVVPDGAYSYRSFLYWSTNEDTDPFWLHQIGTWQGEAERWAMPGTPIPGLNAPKVSHATGDQRISVWCREHDAWEPHGQPVGNLLTGNQASGTDALGTTEGFVVHANATLSRENGLSATGTGSLRVVAGGGAATATAGTPLGVGGIPVSGDTIYTVRASARALTAVASSWNFAIIDWSDSSGVHMRTDDSNIYRNPGPAFTEWAYTFRSPAGAAFASIAFYSPNISNGDSVLVDKIGLWQGAGGEWAMPGTPITGLGTRITRPNIDDRLVEVWNPNKAGGAGWSVVDYDSGWRRVTEWDSAGVVTGLPIIDTVGWGPFVGYNASIHVRRTTEFVSVRFSGAGSLVAKTSDPSGLIHLPSGFFSPSAGSSASVSSSGRSWAMELAINGVLARAGNSSMDVDSINVSFATATFDASGAPIPTSLPGTLVSPAPQ